MQSEGRLLHGVSAKPARSILERVSVAQEREKKGHTLGMIQQSGESGRSPNALSYERLGSCAEFIVANVKLVRKNALDLHKHFYNVKGTYVPA